MEQPVTARILDGKALASQLRADLAADVARLASAGRPPKLVAVRVGNDPASEIYVRNKHKAAAAVGIATEEFHLPDSIAEVELLELVRELNARPDVDAILVQLPLPPHINADKVIVTVDPLKDADGFHPHNLGLLVMGKSPLPPATPSGIMALLAQSGVPLSGAEAVVIGRSQIVGRPVALMLTSADATVTLCHSRTVDLASHCRRADVLIAALGKPRFVPGDWVKPGAVVIDVGVNRLPDSRVVGDVDFDGAARRASAITPVPGGVGPTTIAMLLRNTVQAAKLRRAL